MSGVRTALDDAITCEEMRATAYGLIRLAGRMWVAHLSEHSEEDIVKHRVPPLPEAEQLWDFAERLERLAEEMRPLSQREREASRPRWLPAVLDVVVRKFAGMRA